MLSTLKCRSRGLVTNATLAVIAQVFARGEDAGDRPDHLPYRTLTQALQEAGIDYRESDRLETVRAFLLATPSGQTLVVSDRLRYLERVTAIVHALAHLFLGHAQDKSWYLLTEPCEHAPFAVSPEAQRREEDADQLAWQILRGNYHPPEAAVDIEGTTDKNECSATSRPAASTAASLTVSGLSKAPRRVPVSTCSYTSVATPSTVGDEVYEDFAERYRQYLPRVFAYVYGRIRDVQAAEDIASEVFERAFVKADILRHEETFGTWLLTIARNLLISYCGKRNRFGGPVNYELVDCLPTDVAPEDSYLEREEVAKIMGHVRRLPQREQDIIALKFDAELTNAQIAEVMRLTESNVRVILGRTLQKLRKALQEQG